MVGIAQLGLLVSPTRLISLILCFGMFLFESIATLFYFFFVRYWQSDESWTLSCRLRRLRLHQLVVRASLSSTLLAYLLDYLSLACLVWTCRLQRIASLRTLCIWLLTVLCRALGSSILLLSLCGCTTSLGHSIRVWVPQCLAVRALGVAQCLAFSFVLLHDFTMLVGIVQHGFIVCLGSLLGRLPPSLVYHYCTVYLPVSLLAVCLKPKIGPSC